MSERYYVEQWQPLATHEVFVYNVRTNDKALAACSFREDAELIVKALNLLDAVGNRSKPADTVGKLSTRYKYPIERLRESQGRPIHG